MTAAIGREGSRPLCPHRVDGRCGMNDASLRRAAQPRERGGGGRRCGRMRCAVEERRRQSERIEAEHVTARPVVSDQLDKRNQTICLENDDDEVETRKEKKKSWTGWIKSKKSPPKEGGHERRRQQTTTRQVNNKSPKKSSSRDALPSSSSSSSTEESRFI